MDIYTFNLKEELCNFLKEKKIKKFTEVQGKVIPLLLKDKQVFVESPTGSGKTLSFLLPILSKIDISLKELQYIIFVPTRELGRQINNVIKEITSKYLRIKSIEILGGDDYKKQVDSIVNAQIVVATPERFKRIIDQNKINFNYVKYITIDEIDMILGFEMLQTIFEIKESRLPSNIYWSMFSATFNLSLQNWIKKIVKGEVLNIVIKEKDIETKILTLKFDDNRRDEKLLELLNSSRFNPFLSIIFCKTNEEVKHLFDLLKEHSFKKVAVLHKNMNQREINRVVKQIELFDLVYLIATDKIARGMDFPGVSHIINYTLPTDLNYFKHRIGRTNREGGTEGEIYLLYEDCDDQKMDILKKKNKITYSKLKL